MEERLKSQGNQRASIATSSPSQRKSSPGSSPRHHTRPSVGNAFGRGQKGNKAEEDGEEVPPPPVAKDYYPPPTDAKYGGGAATSRPGTARASQQAVPGALPPTPVASEGECELLAAPP